MTGNTSSVHRDFSDIDGVLQAIRLELYRENVGGALDLARAGHEATGDARYREQAQRIEGWLAHVQDRGAYIAAQETQYHRQRWRAGLKLIEKRVRMLLGRKTAKLVRRRATKPEFQLLEREVVARRPARILDGGSGEGSAALALGARHPALRVDGIEVSATNVRLARQLNRYRNVAFHVGLLEEVDRLFPAATFDLLYSLAVLEHVRDVDVTLRAMLTVLKPGGRFCIEVPMHEFAIDGVLPDYEPRPGFCDHVRVFTERELRERFGGWPEFVLHKIPGTPKAGRLPPTLRVIEFGSFFVAVTKPGG